MADTATDLKPAPDTIIGKTGQAFSAAQLITMACHAVLNTQFEAPTPKPDWFDDLNASLEAAKGVADEWIQTLAPTVTSSIPLQVINFGPTFTAVTNQIIALADKNPTARGKDDPTVVQIRELIADGLLPQINDAIGEVEKSSKALEQWGERLQHAHDQLSSGAANIQAAEISLQSDIAKMNNAIKNLHNLIDGENKAIAASAAAIGIGMFALVVGIALAPETGGASLAIGGAIGAAGIIGGAVTWGVMQHKINKQFDEIAKDQKEKADDQRQLVALQGLAMASNGAVSNLSLASSSLSKFRTQWATFHGELQGVVKKLDDAEDTIAVILQKTFTQAAVKEWDSATETANALASRKVTIESKYLPMSDPQAA